MKIHSLWQKSLCYSFDILSGKCHKYDFLKCYEEIYFYLKTNPPFWWKQMRSKNNIFTYVNAFTEHN